MTPLEASGIKAIVLLPRRDGMSQEAFARHHIEVAVPDEASQRKVMAAIHRVKGGDTSKDATALVGEAANYLIGQRADVLITGCTELPLIFTGADASVPVIDPTDVLARAVVRRARVLSETPQPAD